MKSYLMLLAIPLALSCNADPAAKEGAESKSITNTSAPAATQVPANDDFDAFTISFKEAVNKKDKAAIMAMCDGTLNGNEYIENLVENMISHEPTRNCILNNKMIINPALHHRKELESIKDIRAIDCSVKEGNEYISTDVYYFAPKDGKIKLVYNLQAG